jgi:prepilin-type N-terminal cleavage/methylation domain-containing protein
MMNWRRPIAARKGFTLIELLTVIAIVAVLATLLMTSVSSVQRKAREVVCASNLRQIGLSLSMYLDDFDKRPPDLLALVSSRYIGNGDVLACPADKTRFSPPAWDTHSALAARNNGQPHVSYYHPLSWPEANWAQLMRAHSQAGVVICTFHDVRAREGPFSEGLVLRGQLDGVVVRRMVFPEAPALLDGLDAPQSDYSSSPAARSPEMLLPPWFFFSDDPPP